MAKFLLKDRKNKLNDPIWPDTTIFRAKLISLWSSAGSKSTGSKNTGSKSTIWTKVLYGLNIENPYLYGKKILKKFNGGIKNNLSKAWIPIYKTWVNFGENAGLDERRRKLKLHVMEK